MFAAGWYADPRDPACLRYHDGQNWTEHQRPAASPVAAPPASPRPASPGTPAPPTFATPTFTTPYAAPPPAIPPYAAPPPAAAPSWGSQTHQPAPYPPSWPGPAPAGDYPAPYAGGTGRRRGNRPLILGLVVLLAAGLLTGGYFVFLRGDAGPSFTYSGARIKDPSAVLAGAESRLAAIVSERHGAKSSDTRCYYAVPKHPAEGAKKTDIDANLRCGPVLFVDGDIARQYLSFPVTTSGSGGTVTLTSAATPLQADPEAAPSDLELGRPDGKSAPAGPGGLKAPVPPAADADSIVAVEPGLATLPAAPGGAVMGSWSGGVTLTKLGPVDRYGMGDDARSAPAGQKLIGFATTSAVGDDGTSLDLTSSASVSVDGGPGRSVPETTAGQFVVVAVPTAAKSVTLVLEDRGLKQSLSLIDGTPGSSNVLVLARKHRSVRQEKTSRTVFTFTPSVVFADGSSGGSEAAAVTFRYAELTYRNTDEKKPLTASSPRKAIMHVSMTYVGAHERSTFGFPAGLLTFTPAGGKPIRARNLSTTAGRIYNVFEVPGDVTAGTLTVSGAVTQPFTGSGGTYQFAIRTAVRVQLRFQP